MLISKLFSGDTDKLVELLLDGYDHIIDLIDEENVPILEAVNKADQPETAAFLQSILTFEVQNSIHFIPIYFTSINFM